MVMLAVPVGLGAQPWASSRLPVHHSAEQARILHQGYPAPDPLDEMDVEADFAESASDDSLAQAIVEAYESNPVLVARRYELRATDNNLGIALSELRPVSQVQVSGGYSWTDPGRTTQTARPLVDRLNSPYIERNDLGAQLVIDQPLLTGGRAYADIAAAHADIRAGREGLRGSEGDLLVDLIAAYADVRRDTQALRIREKNAQVLVVTLDEVSARRDAGELTRTDIAQAQTQLQAAYIQLNAARAQLEDSRATFTALVGRAPGALAPAPALPLVPGSIDEAFETAERLNPDLSAAVAAERASRARIAAVRAERRPSLSLRGIAGASGPAVPFDAREEDLSLSGRATLTIPLSAGGRLSSQIHQALDRNSADQLRIEAVRRNMVRTIVSAWNQMVTAQRNEGVQTTQLEAARVYYEGSTQEYRAGLRSTFDVLYAQNNLRETQIALLASRRDRYVAQATLLRQLGQLEAAKLIVGAGLYDPGAHVREVRRRGALPWDGAIRALDGIGAPGQDQQGIEPPARAPDTPVMAPAVPPSNDLPLITHSPDMPLPGTRDVPAKMRSK